MRTDLTATSSLRTRRATFRRVLALGCALGLPTGAEAEPPKDGAALRLATFNIHHAERPESILDLARDARAVRAPDVVGFQEVHVPFRARSQFVDQADRL